MMLIFGEYEVVFTGQGFMLPEAFTDIFFESKSASLMICENQPPGFWTLAEYIETNQGGRCCPDDKFILVAKPASQSDEIVLPAVVIESMECLSGDVLFVEGRGDHLVISSKAAYDRQVAEATRLILENKDLLDRLGF